MGASRVRLTSVQGSFRAHVVAARLRAEGLDPTLRGPVDGPYALTVGDLACIDVFVPDDELADAELVILAGDVDEVLAAPAAWAVDERRPRWPRWVAGVVLLLAVAAPLASAATR